MQVGDTTAWERTFTEDDVLQFGRLTGDQGIHHVERDEQGRLLVQGLLTASLPTKLGGDMNYIAREMSFEFLRPVFTGDTIRCEVVISHLEKVESRVNMVADGICRNQHGKEVLRFHTRGIIRGS